MGLYVNSIEQAADIIRRYEKCGICEDCGLRDGGWKCSYVYEQAVKYLEKLGQKNN